MEIEFDLLTEGDELPDAFLSSYELEMMFDNTRQSIRSGLERKFDNVTCDEHCVAPKFKITGIYDNETEQMDMQYHVDTCCQMFLVRVMRILNQR
jgi:hypothetical protein